MQKINAAYCYRRSAWWSLCLSVSALGIPVSPAKTAEPIEISFGGQTGVGPTSLLLDGSAHWRHRENTTYRNVRRHAASRCHYCRKLFSQTPVVGLFTGLGLQLSCHIWI